jgi:hypothetical protein
VLGAINGALQARLCNSNQVKRMWRSFWGLMDAGDAGGLGVAGQDDADAGVGVRLLPAGLVLSCGHVAHRDRRGQHQSTASTDALIQPYVQRSPKRLSASSYLLARSPTEPERLRPRTHERRRRHGLPMTRAQCDGNSYTDPVPRTANVADVNIDALTTTLTR